MNPRLFLLSLVGFALFLTGCGNMGNPSGDPNAPRPLRVGVSGQNAPLIYKSGRNWSGVEADMARALGQELDREVKFVRMSFDRLIPSLQRGDIDIVMDGLTVLNQRKTLVDFTTPYLNSGQGLLVRSDSAGTFQDPRIIFLFPYRIGVEQGTVAHQLAQQLHASSTVTSYASAQKAANALQAGKIDAVLHDAPVLYYISAQNPTAGYQIAPRLVAHDTLAWAVRRGNSDLRNKANAALAKWKKNGTLDRILRSYMPRYDIMKSL